MTKPWSSNPKIWNKKKKSSRSVAIFGKQNLALWTQHAFLVKSANSTICTRGGWLLGMQLEGGSDSPEQPYGFSSLPWGKSIFLCPKSSHVPSPLPLPLPWIFPILIFLLAKGRALGWVWANSLAQLSLGHSESGSAFHTLLPQSTGGSCLTRSYCSTAPSSPRAHWLPSISQRPPLR